MAKNVKDLTTDEREFVERLAMETGLRREQSLPIAMALSELAAKHWKLALMDVELGLSSAQKLAQEAIEREFRDSVKMLPGVKDAAFMYDPRGTTVGLKFKSGAYNSFGDGGMWKVPVPNGAVQTLESDFWREHVPQPDLTPEEPMESLSGATMRLDRRSGMVEVVYAGQVTSFGGVPAIKKWAAEHAINKADAQRLYELDAHGSQRKELSFEAKVALADVDGELVLFKSKETDAYVALMPNGNVAITDGYSTDYVNFRGGGRWVRESDQLEIGQDIRDFLSASGSAEGAATKEQKRDGYIVLTIGNTDNAAFVDVGRDEEIARIISEAADKFENEKATHGGNFLLQDSNGNRVGEAKRVNEVVTEKVDAGTVRLSIGLGGGAFDEDDTGVEIARILRDAAKQVRDGNHNFPMRDSNGNSVGEFKFAEPKTLDADAMLTGDDCEPS